MTNYDSRKTNEQHITQIFVLFEENGKELPKNTKEWVLQKFIEIRIQNSKIEPKICFANGQWSDKGYVLSL